MLYALICDDRPGGLELRKANRSAHLDYIRATGVVAQAGPFLDGEGAMVGSLVILDVPDRAAAEAGRRAIPMRRRGCSRRSRSGPGTG
jgi:uncharacterized protein